ncbi:hypothetical protein [Amycolatopsis magusensis]|uniref:hypothetical protein n=1 Tax=Amycolatopsis magusensis TaxID=882444 RepID=UPI003C2CE24C
MQTHRNSFLNRMRILSALATTLAAMATIDAEGQAKATAGGGRVAIEVHASQPFMNGWGTVDQQGGL